MTVPWERGVGMDERAVLVVASCEVPAVWLGAMPCHDHTAAALTYFGIVVLGDIDDR